MVSKRRTKEKNIIRSAYSGLIVNGKPVILCSEAIDFVKKMGYSVFDTIFDKPKPYVEVINPNAMP